jgi:replication-associated recombination protein RarA
MDFFKLKHKLSFRHKQEQDFDNICGYNDVKDIVLRALQTDESFNLLLCGPPASSKTLFLLAIQKQDHSAVYFDGSNTTNKILDIMEQQRPHTILLDGLDKMSRPFQHQLLNFLESGRVKVDEVKRSYDFEIKNSKVFATANDLSCLSKPLQSRFRRLHLPPYTQEQFLAVATKVLPKLREETVHIIASQVWSTSKDVRDVISVGKLIRRSDTEEDVKQII